MMSIWTWIKRRFQKNDDVHERPPASLVLLLRKHRYLDAAMLIPMVERTFDVVITPGAGETTFVVGEPDSPTFMIKVDWRIYFLHRFARHYFEDMEGMLQTIRDLRLRRALSEHNAWLSVDALMEDAPEDPYLAIGKLIAELLDDNCAAIYSPATNQIAVYDPGIEDVLRGPEPLRIFEQFAKLPIVEVADDDPEMATAVATARRRWPEFVAAFEGRTESQHFAVKAPFAEGEDCEFMWLTVTGIENDVIFGTLDNDPGALKRLASGSRVRIPVPELNDWIIAEGDIVAGGFTIDVLRRRFGDPQS